MQAKFLFCYSIGLCLVIAGCAGTPPSTFYIFSPMEQAANHHLPPGVPENISVSLGPVYIPEFLDRPQVVTRSGVNTMELAEFHRWAGSFRSNFLSVVGENLALLLKSDRILTARQQGVFKTDYSVSIRVNQFGGTRGGDVVLSVGWTVRDKNDKAHFVVEKSVIREATGAPDYETYVAAQSRALEKLSRKIAHAIEQLALVSR